MNHKYYKDVLAFTKFDSYNAYEINLALDIGNSLKDVNKCINNRNNSLNLKENEKIMEKNKNRNQLVNLISDQKNQKINIVNPHLEIRKNYRPEDIMQSLFFRKNIKVRRIKTKLQSFEEKSYSQSKIKSNRSYPKSAMIKTISARL